MGTPLTGHKMKLYRNTNTVAAPTWVEIAEIGDVSMPDLSRGVAEVKRRTSDFTKNLPSIIQSIAIEFKLFHGISTTNFDAIRASFFAGTVEEWAIMNGDITVTGNEGLRLPVIIEQFPWDQPLEDVSSHDIRVVVGWMEEASAEVDPVWYPVP